MRLRYGIELNPPPRGIADLPSDTEVVFAPMESIPVNGGPLDISQRRPLGGVRGGSYSYFEEGDLLLAKVTPCFENGKKALVQKLPTKAGFATSEVHVIRVRNEAIDRRYLNYVFSSHDFRSAAIAAMTGASGLRRVPEGVLLDYRLPIIDVNEQRRIADFLDRKTARIDELIGTKERLACALGTQRQRLLETIVKGQDRKDVELVDSGVEWVGRFPRHWQAPKFTHVARLVSGHTPSRHNKEYWIPEECVIPWFTLSDVGQLRQGNMYVETTNERISERGLANSAARLLPAGTVILSRTASVGFPGIMKIPMATTQDFVNWVCGPKIRPKYLYYVLLSMRREFDRLMHGSTHQTIYMPAVRSFRTPLPPLDEQDSIVSRLDTLNARYSRLSTLVTDSVKRLKELRVRLITSAVTGQTDAHSLPACAK